MGLGNQGQKNLEVDPSYLSPVGDISLKFGSNSSLIVSNSTATETVATGAAFNLNSVAWRPDGSYALIVGDGGTLIQFFSCRAGMIHLDSGTTDDLSTVSWKPDGLYALITGSNGVVIRFDHDTQRCLRIPTNTNLKLVDIQWDTSGERAEISVDGGTPIVYPPPVDPLPVLRIDSPAGGSAVSGTFTVEGTASFRSGHITRVEVRIDSGGWLPATGTSGWEIALDSRPYDSGLHTVAARAWTDAPGVVEASVQVRFENIDLPPVVEILSPADCGRVSGMVAVEGTAASFSGTHVRVDVRVDDFEWGGASGGGFWRLTLDTTTLPNGVHRLQARVWDGRAFSAASRLVIVENPVIEPLARARERPAGPGGMIYVPAPEELSRNGPDSPSLPDPGTPGPGPLPAPGEPAGAVAPMKDGGTISVPAVSWAMLLLATLALGTEPGKFAFFQFFFVPLYSRIRKDAVLDNFTRGMIYGFIMSHPGVHYNFIKQKLGLNNGSIVYHLTVLERQELIKSEKVGLYKRFYPMGRTLSETGIMELNETQEAMVELIRGSPGLSQREISERMKLSTRVVNYHIGLLQRARLVVLEKEGKTSRCFATERMPVC